MIRITDKECEIYGKGAELLSEYTMITRTLVERLPAEAVEDAYKLGTIPKEQMYLYMAARLMQKAKADDDSEDDDMTFNKMFGDLFNE